MDQLAIDFTRPIVGAGFKPAQGRFETCPYTETEARVLAVLEMHVGRANAVKAVDIASAMNLSGDRPVREAVKSLTENHGYWIASSIRPPYGFYMIDDSDEGFEYAENLFSRAMSILRRYSKIKKKSAFEICEQIKLFLTCNL